MTRWPHRRYIELYEVRLGRRPDLLFPTRGDRGVSADLPGLRLLPRVSLSCDGYEAHSYRAGDAAPSSRNISFGSVQRIPSATPPDSDTVVTFETAHA